MQGAYIILDRLLQKGAQVRKKPDVLRWLSKVSSIREHYLHVAQIPISPTLSGLLLRGVKVIVLKNPPLVRKFSLDRDELENILVSAGCEFIAKDKSEKSIEKFLDKLAVAHGGKVTDGKLGTSHWPILRVSFDRCHRCLDHGPCPLRMPSPRPPASATCRALHRRV